MRILVIAKDSKTYMNWLRMSGYDPDNYLYIHDYQSILGIDKKNVSLMLVGMWWGNTKAIEAVAYAFGITLLPESSPII